MTAADAEQGALPDPLRGTLDAFKAEYSDLSDTWRHLDGKAQGTAATAGIFLAAAFAFVRSFSEGQVPTGSRPALVIANVLLVASVILAVLALRIREVTAAPFGDRLEELTNDLMRIKNNEERRSRASDFIREQIEMWRRVNNEMSAENERKACLILTSQVLLLLAVLSVASITVAILLEWI
jgi:hypothetical protein